MPRSLLRLLPLAVLALPPSVTLGAHRPGPAPAGTVALAGSVMPDLARLMHVGTLSAGRPLGIGVALRIAHPAQLDTLVRQVSDPRSPNFRHYLSVTEFRHRFAPGPRELRRVRAWLHGSGLRVSYQSPSGLLIEAHGSARAVQRAFHTQLLRFRQRHATFFANATPVRVPAALAGTIEAVVGLDNRGRVSHPLLKRTGQARPHDPSSQNGYTPSDLQHIYDLSPMLSAGITGAGQSIGIISYQVNLADITTFDQEYSLPLTPPQQVEVKDPRNTRNYRADWLGVAEAELDTEMAHAAAPGAGIVLYNDANERLDSIYYSLAQMVSENRVQVISSSLGGPENHWAAFPRIDLVAATHEVLLEAAAQGQTVLSASGDNAAFDAATDGRAEENTLMVEYACADPYVTCVGGTSLRDTSAGTYGSETVWSDGSDPTNPTGSGGGISQLFARPPWQTGPGTDNSYSAAKKGRMVPDVSADADPNTGYAVHVVNSRFLAEDNEYGGTSAATPVWAGLTALLDASLNERIGFFNPTLYALGAQADSLPSPPFHDVTTGNNLYYPATAGYDLATGWGSPDGAALAAGLHQIGRLVRTPIVVVPAAHVQQKKGNRFVNVTTVTRGKKARFTVTYRITDGEGAARGLLQIYRGGRITGAWGLSGGAGDVGTMKRGVTLKRSGSYTATFTVSVGDYSTPISVTFKVA